MTWRLLIPKASSRAGGYPGPLLVFFALVLGKGTVILLRFAFKFLPSVVMEPPAEGFLHEPASGAGVRGAKDCIKLADHVRAQRDSDLGFGGACGHSRHNTPPKTLTFSKMI